MQNRVPQDCTRFHHAGPLAPCAGHGPCGAERTSAGQSVWAVPNCGLSGALGATFQSPEIVFAGLAITFRQLVVNHSSTTDLNRHGSHPAGQRLRSRPQARRRRVGRMPKDSCRRALLVRLLFGDIPGHLPAGGLPPRVHLASHVPPPRSVGGRPRTWVFLEHVLQPRLAGDDTR